MLYDNDTPINFFEDNDNFGVDTFRDNLGLVIGKNMVEVIHRKKLEGEDNDGLNGNFGSDFSLPSEPVFESYRSNINIISRNTNTQPLKQQGYDGRGTVVYDCISVYDTVFGVGDEVVFLNNYDFGIRKGDVFRVLPGDTGVVGGRFTHQSFSMVFIRHSDKVIF